MRKGKNVCCSLFYFKPKESIEKGGQTYGNYTKLSIEERAALFPVPTNDYEAEYGAYCQRMFYTEEKMKSIRYKMAVYDEFLKEYNYRKKHYGVRDDSRKIAVSEKNRGAR